MTSTPSAEGGHALITDYPEFDELLHALDDDGVLLLTLNRPDRNNAWTHAL
jgi:hypothetical protein